MTLYEPSPGNETRPFGLYKVGGVVRMHYGTDRGWGNGTTVRSMAAGTVTSVAILGDYGKTVTIQHDDPIDGKVAHSRYCHLASEVVDLGTHYPALTVIGQMGSTGSLTDQVHLHSELYLNGVRVDERKYQTGSAPAGGTATPGSTAPAPTPTATRKDEDMYLIGNTPAEGGSGFLVTSSGVTTVTGTEYTLLARVIKSNQTLGMFPEVFNNIELGIINTAIRRTIPATTPADTGAIITALQEAVNLALADVDIDFDVAAIVAGLEPQFTAIPGAVLDAQAARLAN